MHVCECVYIKASLSAASPTNCLHDINLDLTSFCQTKQDRKAETLQLMGMIHEERMEAEAALTAIIPEEEQAKVCLCCVRRRCALACCLSTEVLCALVAHSRSHTHTHICTQTHSQICRERPHAKPL